MCSVVTKVLNKMILLGIRPVKVQPKWLQARQRRGSTPHILALRRLLEGVRTKSIFAVIIFRVFIDFREAFDTVDIVPMLTILKAYDIPDKDTATYQDQECVPSDHCTARVISTESRGRRYYRAVQR